MQALKWTQPIWEGLSEDTQEELVALQLWEKENMVAFGREVKQGCAAHELIWRDLHGWSLRHTDVVDHGGVAAAAV